MASELLRITLFFKLIWSSQFYLISILLTFKFLILSILFISSSESAIFPKNIWIFFWINLTQRICILLFETINFISSSISSFWIIVPIITFIWNFNNFFFRDSKTKRMNILWIETNRLHTHVIIQYILGIIPRFFEILVVDFHPLSECCCAHVFYWKFAEYVIEMWFGLDQLVS